MALKGGKRFLKLYLTGEDVTQTILKWFSWDLTYYSIHAVLMSWCTLKSQIRSHMQLKEAAEGGHPNRYDL